MADRDPPPDWIDRLAGLAGWLGFNPVRVRWRLQRWRQAARDRKARAGQKVEQIRYRHKTCPGCGRVNDAADDVCAGCGARLGGRVWQVLFRVGLAIPEALSVSSLLGLAMVAVYARMVLFEGGPDSLFSFRAQTLFHFGGHWPEAVWAGEWWRLGTSILLHLGLWHLGFNLFALSQIGPAIEELIGRGRMLLLFLLTGVLANLGSEAWGLHGVAIGASGAIMGLCGLAAGWGQRDGTSIGQSIRNRMLKWALYTVLFGVFIGADNAAHVCGFLTGAAIGFAVRPDYLRRSRRIWLRVVQGLVGGAAALGLVGVALAPPDSPLEERFERQTAWDWDEDNPYGPWLEVCELVRAGRTEDALALWRARLPDDLEFDLELEPGQFEQACQGIEQQQEQCRKYRAGGLEAVYGPAALPQDPGQRLQIERDLRGTCSWLQNAQPEGGDQRPSGL